MLGEAERRRKGLLAALVVVLVVGGWWAWPSVTASAGAHTLVVGDGEVTSSGEEIARRFRQEGVPVEVATAEACAAAEALARGYDRVVLSFDDWSGCAGWPPHTVLLVEQPYGAPVPADRAGGVAVRHPLDLFSGGDRARCAWWDTPGAGEQVPGLGRCEADGLVTIRRAGQLTPAGRERFARMIVESVK